MREGGELRHVRFREPTHTGVRHWSLLTKDSDRYRFANFTKARPLFRCLARDIELEASARTTTPSVSFVTTWASSAPSGLAERVGRSRRYRLTPDGVRLGALLVKIRTRLLGPIFADPTLAPKPRSKNPSTVEAALRTVDRALDTLCSTLGLSAAAA